MELKEGPFYYCHLGLVRKALTTNKIVRGSTPSMVKESKLHLLGIKKMDTISFVNEKLECLILTITWAEKASILLVQI